MGQGSREEPARLAVAGGEEERFNRPEEYFSGTQLTNAMKLAARERAKQEQERRPRLDPEDAEAFAADIERARRELPPLRDPWAE